MIYLPKQAYGNKRRLIGAMTHVDLIVVVGIALMGIILLAKAAGSADRQGSCEVRLRWLGVSFSEYAKDNQDRLPWEVPTSDGGSSNYISVPFSAFRHYLVGSNYFDSPHLLLCPQDERHRAAQWYALSNSNLSYFVSVTARRRDSRSVLAGDRYLTSSVPTSGGLLDVRTNSIVEWAEKYHSGSGYLLYTDGSVALTKSNLVKHLLGTSERSGVQLAIP